LLSFFLIFAVYTWPLLSQVPFVRGDTNNDGSVDVVDVGNIFAYLFSTGESPPCQDAWDANDDGLLNIADPITILGSYCSGSRAFCEPWEAPGADPTQDDLSCEAVPSYKAFPEEGITLGVGDCLIAGGEESKGKASLWITTDKPVGGFSLR